MVPKVLSPKKNESSGNIWNQQFLPCALREWLTPEELGPAVTGNCQRRTHVPG